jgi:hypothetical protein
MRAALFVAGCLLAPAHAQAPGHTPTLAELSSLDTRQREAALVAIRDHDDGDAILLTLETELGTLADARRHAAQPPLFPGCLTGEEFELTTQLKLARTSADGTTYRALAAEYRRLTNALRTMLGEAQSSGVWRKNFSHLGHWISDWSKVDDPMVRELLYRTLNDQAIRASLSSFQGEKVYVVARPTPALRAYDEYLFNLMCISDEDNLKWLRRQIATHGWFDIRRFGKAADQAAWLMIQHADGDPNYQAYIVSLLASKVHSGDTNPQNYAFLNDHIAVRAGAPQTFATQMECVNGAWLAPNVIAPKDLDARRASVGLPPYAKQLARRKNLYCSKQAVR